VFDVVFFDAPANGRTSLVLARFDPSGESVASKVTLVPDVFYMQDETDSPGLAFDGTHLAVAFGGTLQTFDLGGVPVGASRRLPFGASEHDSYTVSIDSEVVATSAGYAVITDTESDEGEQMSDVATAVGDDEFALRASEHVALAQVESRLVAVSSSGRVLAEVDPATLTPLGDPQWLGSTPPRALHPRAVRCDGCTCYLLASETVPQLVGLQRRHGVWKVDRQTNQITAPARELTVLGNAVGSPAMGPTQAALVVSGPEQDDEWRLALWEFGQRQDAIRVVPWPDGAGTGRLSSPYEGSTVSLFFEEGALRGLYGDVVEDSTLYQRLFEDGELKATSAVGAVGGQCQARDSYFGWESTLKSDPAHITRWRPDSDSGFSPWAEASIDASVSALQRDICCNRELVGLADPYNGGSLYAMDGTSLGTTPDPSRWCEAADKSLLFIGQSRSSDDTVVLSVVEPDGTSKGFQLDTPQGAWLLWKPSLQWSADTVVMAWRAAAKANGNYLGAYLSFWTE